MPQSARGETPQPLSKTQPLKHNHLQDTLFKLSDDAKKRPGGDTKHPTGWSLEEFSIDSCDLPFASRTTAGTTAGKTAIDGSWGGGDVDGWRNVFLAEARECVEAMQTVCDSANIKHFASRFEDWRKVDMKATVEMQQHVKELVKLNHVMGQFLSECATPDEFVKFKGTVISLTECVDELSTSRREIEASVDVIAERTAKQVVSLWCAEAREASSLLTEHLDAHRERRVLDDERWQSLGSSLEDMQKGLGQLGKEVVAQRRSIDELEATRRRESDRTETALREQHKASREGISRSFDDLIAKLQVSGQENLQEFKGHISEILEGKHDEEMERSASKASNKERSASKASNKVCVGQSLRQLLEQMHEWDRTSRRDAENWRERADKSKEQVEEAANEVQNWQVKMKDAQHEQSKLQEQMQALKNAMQETQHRLEYATSVSFGNGMKRLKTIEQRGRVKANRQNGTITLLKALDFVPVDAGQEVIANFVKPDEAGQVVQDLRDVSGIFGVPMSVQVHAKLVKGTPMPVLEQITIAQADFLKQRLTSAGISEDLIEAKACPGSKQVGVIVQLDKAIFADPEKKKK